MTYTYDCPRHGCDFSLVADDDATIERHVARHEARAHSRKFDRAQFEERLEVS